MISVILKGPSLFVASFLLLWRSLRYFNSSNTFSPTLIDVNPRVILSIIFYLANSCSASASFLASCNSNNRSCVAGTFVFRYAVGMAVGLNSIWRKNRAYF